jgi:predicted PurR-regulated permease PerM
LSSTNGLLKKHWRHIVLILVLISVAWLAWTLRNTLLPYFIGLIIAYMLMPVIKWIEKRLTGVGRKPKHKDLVRISIIVIVYIFTLGLIGLFVYYMVTIIGKSLLSLANDAPNIIPNSLDAVTNWLKSISFLSSPSIQAQIDSLAVKAGAGLDLIIKDLPSRGFGMIQSTSGMFLGFFTMPFFLFYILKDWDTMNKSFKDALPIWMRVHTVNIFSIVQNVVGRYIRGQLFLGLVIGLCVFALLMIMRIDFALPLAAFAGITELVPMIGPWLGGIAGVLVTLAVAPEKVIWVGLGYIVIQLLENSLLVPKIQGRQMNLNPALIIVISVLGAHFAGILGFIIALPLTMTVVELFKYFRNHLRDRDVC